MMRVVFWILCATLAACATENLYEGFKAREALRDPVPGHHAGAAMPSYQDYHSERERLLDAAQR